MSTEDGAGRHELIDQPAGQVAVGDRPAGMTGAPAAGVASGKLTAPGGLRPRHLIALRLLSERGPASQQHGLITRRRDPADRRRHIVELSARADKELGLANALYGLLVRANDSPACMS